MLSVVDGHCKKPNNRSRSVLSLHKFRSFCSRVACVSGYGKGARSASYHNNLADEDSCFLSSPSSLNACGIPGLHTGCLGSNGATGQGYGLLHHLYPLGRGAFVRL